MTIRRFFSPRLRILSRALRLSSIRNVKIQLHKIPFSLDAIHLFDEPALLLLLHHLREKVIEGRPGRFSSEIAAQTPSETGIRFVAAMIVL
jgi:hypothetical protein